MSWVLEVTERIVKYLLMLRGFYFDLACLAEHVLNALVALVKDHLDRAEALPGRGLAARDFISMFCELSLALKPEVFESCLGLLTQLGHGIFQTFEFLAHRAELGLGTGRLFDERAVTSLSLTD